MAILAQFATLLVIMRSKEEIFQVFIYELGQHCVKSHIGPESEYSHDASPLDPNPPVIVVEPDSTQTLEKALKVAEQLQLNVVTRGSGTGTTGGALPTENSMLLSLKKLNQLIEIDDENRTITVQPGVITADIQKAAQEKGLFYPPDPASINDCSIGGNVAENAGGPRCVKYGVTGDYVMGIKGYYVDGTPFSYGGKSIKNVAGYDIMRLLIGSEGTLAIFTEIILKLIPYPAFRQPLLASFSSHKAALSALNQARSSDISPSVAEFMDHTCFMAAEKYLGQSFEFANGDSFVFFEVDGFSKESVEKDIKQLNTLCQKYHSISTYHPKSVQEIDELWNIRRSLSPALRQYGRSKVSHDISVPVSEISHVVSSFSSIGLRHNVLVLGYGHLGDGNIHVNIINLHLDNTHWNTAKKNASQDIMELAVKVGGSLTGEHGIGLSKKHFLPLMFSENDLALFQRIKHAFDPDNRLNPGKAI